MAFAIRPTTEADLPRICEIMQAQLPDPPSLESLIRNQQNRPPEMVWFEVGAYTPDGLLVGYGGAEGGPWMKPGHMRLYVRVDQAYRRQGAGRALRQEAERFIREQQATVITASARDHEPASLAFAEQAGYAAVHHLFESRLDLDRFDPTPFQGALGKAEAEGIRFTSLADLPQDEETLQRFLDFLYELNQDVPGFDGQPRVTLEMYRYMTENDPNHDPRGIILAVADDRWAALSYVQRRDNGSYYNAFTGVHRDFRGRGLALAVKLVSIDYVRSRGGTYVRTNNHSQNQRMLAVNRKLGYQPEPGFFHLERQVTSIHLWSGLTTHG